MLVECGNFKALEQTLRALHLHPNQGVKDTRDHEGRGDDRHKRRRCHGASLAVRIRVVFALLCRSDIGHVRAPR